MASTHDAEIDAAVEEALKDRARYHGGLNDGVAHGHNVCLLLDERQRLADEYGAELSAVWKDLEALRLIAGLDVERLRRAIYAVSLRHNWATTADVTDRTDEIAAEYMRPSEPVR